MPLLSEHYGFLLLISLIVFISIVILIYFRIKGGFNVDYKNLGIDEHRSRYDDTALTILINLDHPVIKTALDKKGPEDISFKRLAYEIAFTEYSLAVGYELINQDPDMPADDLMYEVRSTLNRISRNAAGLYRI